MKLDSMEKLILILIVVSLTFSTLLYRKLSVKEESIISNQVYPSIAIDLTYSENWPIDKLVTYKLKE